MYADNWQSHLSLKIALKTIKEQFSAFFIHYILLKLKNMLKNEEKINIIKNWERESEREKKSVWKHLKQQIFWWYAIRATKHSTFSCIETLKV